jgi:large subunit ribosomal protein L20
MMRLRALRYGYIGRRLKKRNMRSLWIVRINGALTGKGINYNRFINGLKRANVALNRKVIADLALNDSAAFDQLVELAKKQFATAAANAGGVAN